MDANLPREIIKWLQSLDLSFCVKNPKRDFSNGFLVAEILSRYYPKDINMNNYENGQRLAAKVDNWEQLYKVFKKKGFAIAKEEFDAVIHCAPGAAPAFIFHLYNVLTTRTVKEPMNMKAATDAVPAFMRDTASKRLKDHEIHRIQDNVERTIRAIDTLGAFHEERRQQKVEEAPLLIRQERRLRGGLQGTELDAASKEELQDSVRIDEVRVKAMTGNEGKLRGKENMAEKQKGGTLGKTQLQKSATLQSTSAGALAGMQPPAFIVKPAADIMRPMVLAIIQESEEMSKLIKDTRSDVVVSFVEQCRESLRRRDRGGRTTGDRASGQSQEQRMEQIEETCIKVFETLAHRAQLLVDTLTKSAPEFWKVWSTFFPVLVDFSESSPIFASAVHFFRRLGELVGEADAPLAQQLITEVGLPWLSKELARSPEKRECLCEILYCYAQEDTLNHLLVLRALRERVGEDPPVYVSCLSCLVPLDANLGLLDEHLLDLYVYYGLVALQNPQPRIRVAGLSILSTIAVSSSQYRSILALIPNFAALAADEWWEVQAQLLLLSTNLLQKLSVPHGQDPGTAGNDDDDQLTGSSKVLDQAPDEVAVANEEATEGLLNIINQLFVVGNSKHVLQVALFALAPLLPEYSNLLPVFVAVLLEQPPALRQRLLTPETDAADRTLGRRTYVMGNSSRMYEERCIRSFWPHLDTAKTLVRQLDTLHLERLEYEHIEVLEASIPEAMNAEEDDEWLTIFDKVKPYVFIALVDPELHHLSTAIIKKFWLNDIEKVSSRSIEASKKHLLQALRFLYGPSAGRPPCVDEEQVLGLLRELRACGGNVELEVTSVVESFQETHPEEYQLSNLGLLFAT